MDNTEVSHKELDLIQGAINRRSNTSFLLKEWLISLIAAIPTLTKEATTMLNAPKTLRTFPGFIIIVLISLTLPN